MAAAKKTGKTARKSAPAAAHAPPAAPPKSKKGGPAGGTLAWEQTSKSTWLAPDPEGDTSRAGARITMATERWLHGPDADPIYWVYRDGKYLGSDTSLGAAQRRAQYREQSSTVLRDGEKDGVPAFLQISEQERKLERAKMPLPTARPSWGRELPEAEAESVVKKARQTRESLTPVKPDKPERAKRGEKKAAAARIAGEDDAVISLKTKKNPRKPNTGKHARFQVIMDHDGKTVREFRAAGGNSETLANAVKEGLAELRSTEEKAK